MKRALLSLVGIATLTTTLYAKNNDWFAGVSTGNIKADFYIKSNNSKLASGDTDGKTRTLTVGKYLAPNKIVSFSNTFVEEDSKNDIDAMSLSYKYVYEKINRTDTSLFVGGSYSLFKYKESGLKSIDPNYSSDSASWRTNIIHLDIGFLVDNITENINLELGYKFDIYTDGEGSITNNNTSYKLGYDSFRHIYIGLNYKF